MTLGQQFLLQLGDIIDTSYCHYRKFAKMAVHDNGLGIGVTYDTDTDIPGKVLEVSLKLRTEITVLDIVYRAGKDAVVACCDTCALCTHVGVVVNSVK